VKGSRQRTDARLWIVGDGPETAALHRLAKELDITETCTFLGARSEGIEFVAAGDITAMTTLYEAHGIVALESMACGRPIVLNDVDGPRDSVTDGIEGFLVPPADIETFAEKLLLLIGNAALRKKMGEAGRVRAEEFSAARISGDYLALIEEVLAEDRGRGSAAAAPQVKAEVRP